MVNRLSFEEVMKLSEDELEVYVDKCLKELEAPSMNFIFTPHNYKTNFRRGFLRDNIIICPKPDELIGYNMSGVDYVYLIKTLKNVIDYDELMIGCDEECFFDNTTFLIDDYFGIEDLDKLTREEIEDNRLNILYDTCLSVDEKCYAYDEKGYLDVLRRIGIDIFYGTGEVKCLERAALLQNLLYVLGYDSYIVMSLIKNENETSLHAFNLINKNGKYFYVDSSINNIFMSCCFLEECNVKEISEQEFNNLLSGEESVDISYEYFSNGKKLAKTYSVIGNAGISDFVGKKK